MLHCIITPTKYINNPQIGGQSDFLLVLSHLLDENCKNQYAEEVKKFRDSGKQIYLDNGLFENHTPEDGGSLIHKAKLIQADVVFAPDHLYDNKKTQQAFEEFADLAGRQGYEGKLAYVVQASEMLEYVAGFKWAEKNPRVDIIAMSILSVPKSFGMENITEARRIAMTMIDIYLDPKKPVHMLGLGQGLGDLLEARMYPWIESNDSCSAYMTGFYNKAYDLETLEVPGGKIQEKVQFDYDGELSSSQKENIVKNIQFLKDYAL